MRADEKTGTDRFRQEDRGRAGHRGARPAVEHAENHIVAHFALDLARAGELHPLDVVGGGLRDPGDRFYGFLGFGKDLLHLINGD
ncbi:hypothetical protein G6F59_018605 [Rhizopus arrhizus]|nr:hypothetical protein G6F59_018605 [Rhizopus arrhizus]